MRRVGGGWLMGRFGHVLDLDPAEPVQHISYPEYSEVFFTDDDYRVLRGASWATSIPATRNSFRNWDYRILRQIFAGVRLAWDHPGSPP
jgi:formylglycine-generating enzyme required for sulfatase activity